MPDNENRRLILNDRSYSGIIKREIKEFAAKAGVQIKRLGELEVIVSEMLTNVIKYGGEKAEFLIKKINDENKKGVEIICLDKGRGMKNPEYMLMDGVSTSGSLGQGLGAILRLSDEFDLYSLSKWGTIVLSRIFNRKNSEKIIEKVNTGYILLALKQGEENGDGFNMEIKGNKIRLIFTDGLGHGANAYKATTTAIKSFVKSKSSGCEEIIRSIHADIRHTRGVVCFLLMADLKNNQVRYCGVGNIFARIISGDNHKNLVNHNGIVGYVLPSSIKETSMIWQPNDLIVIHSDGISSRWMLKNYPNIEKHDPVMLAAAIYKDYGRPQDDNSILVIKRGARKNYYN